MQHSTLYTLVFAAVVCLVCSVLVSGSAVALRERQARNARLDKQRNVLEVAGLTEPGEKVSASVAQQRFDESIGVRLVELSSGEYAPDEQTLLEDFDPKETPQYGQVYVVEKVGEVDRIVLPVSGKGLWSTLYGLLAMDADGTTIRGITFYEHAETPGLGGEIDNPKWKASWDGRTAFDEVGRPIIEVVKGRAQAPHEVDGLSGATLTRVVVPVCMSRRKTSAQPFVSSATRLVAFDRNTTYRPSALRAASDEEPSPSVPSLATLTRTVVPVWRSWTNTSYCPFVSPATRLVEFDSNAT